MPDPTGREKPERTTPREGPDDLLAGFATAHRARPAAPATRYRVISPFAEPDPAEQS